MNPHGLLLRHLSVPFPCPTRPPSLRLHSRSFHISCSSLPSHHVKAQEKAGRSEYRPNVLDGVFLTLFRNKMAKEVGWDSDKPGYDGLIEVANHLMFTGRTNADTREAAVRILRSLFPPFLLELYKMLITPLAGGKVAAVMVARVTAFTCQWLMGTCVVNSIELPNGTSLQSGVFVEKCKYLEESKCVGICVNTCKLPTQTFFSDYMGIPLVMEPNFTDYSCQFKFGVVPPLLEDDSTLKEPCLDICPVQVEERLILFNVRRHRFPASFLTMPHISNSNTQCNATHDRHHTNPGIQENKSYCKNI